MSFFTSQWKSGLRTFAKPMVDLHFCKTFGIAFVFELFPYNYIFEQGRKCRIQGSHMFLCLHQIIFSFLIEFLNPLWFYIAFAYAKSKIKCRLCLFFKMGARRGGDSFPRITANLKEDMKPSTLRYNLY